MSHIEFHISDIWVIFLAWQTFYRGDSYTDMVFDYQGPDVQSIVSLTSLLTGQLFKCYITL